MEVITSSQTEFQKEIYECPFSTHSDAIKKMRGIIKIGNPDIIRELAEHDLLE